MILYVFMPKGIMFKGDKFSGIMKMLCMPGGILCVMPEGIIMPNCYTITCYLYVTINFEDTGWSLVMAWLYPYTWLGLYLLRTC